MAQNGRLEVAVLTRDDLLGYLQQNNAQAFLRVIRAGESSNDDSAYAILNGGEHFTAPPWEHPNRVGKNGRSTAAGAYQYIFKTWNVLSQKYGLPDFSPINQDCGAVALILEHGAMQDVLAGRVREAIRRINSKWVEWECFENPIFLSKVKAIFEAYGGKSGEAAQPAPAPTPTPSIPAPPTAQKVKPMGIFAALLPSILQALPQLAQIFSTDGTSRSHNVAAVSVVSDALVKATQSPNLQAAVESLGDPDKLRAAQAAIADVWPSLVEVGGGGIDGARKAAAAPDQIPFWKNGAFVLSVVLVPLIYMVAVEILFNPSGQTWSDDIKMMFVTAIVSGLLGSITGFFLGSSLKDNGGQRRTDFAGAK